MRKPEPGLGAVQWAVRPACHLRDPLEIGRSHFPPLVSCLACLSSERAPIFHSLSLSPSPSNLQHFRNAPCVKALLSSIRPTDRPTDRNMWGHFLPVKWGMKARRMRMPKWRLCYQVLTLFCTNDGTDKDPHPNEIAGVF